MRLTLQRLHLTSRSTCGELFVEGQPSRFCYTLELPVVDGLPGSCIPPGLYPVKLSPSPKFMASSDVWVGKFASSMPHVICPPRTLIMIHWGNEPENTEGCILVGYTHDLDVVGESRAAFEALYAIIEGSATIGDCTIDVQGGIPHEARWPNE